MAPRDHCSGRGLAPPWRYVSAMCTASSPRPLWDPDSACNAPEETGSESVKSLRSEIHVLGIFTDSKPYVENQLYVSP